VTPSDSAAIRERLAAALAPKYRVETEAGRGAMARIYRATALDTGRAVAVKLLPPEAATGANAERFLREIDLTRNLDHPNILPLLDSGAGDGLLWYLMPFVEGETIRDALKARGVMAVADAVAIAREVADGLDYAHARGVVHRDLKPDNVMLTEGRAVILDFGLARALDLDSKLTGTGMPLGTPAYMSPEQITGAAGVDARSDVYGFGCVVYEMVTGRPPFSGNSVVQLLQGHLSRIPEPPSRVRTEVPPAVDGALARALAKEPKERFASAGAFAAALAQGPAEPTGSAPGLLRRLFGR